MGHRCRTQMDMVPLGFGSGLDPMTSRATQSQQSSSRNICVAVLSDNAMMWPARAAPVVDGPYGLTPSIAPLIPMNFLLV